MFAWFFFFLEKNVFQKFNLNSSIKGSLNEKKKSNITLLRFGIPSKEEVATSADLEDEKL